MTLAEIARLTNSKLSADWGDRVIDDIAPLDTAGRTDISFVDEDKCLDELTDTRAGACFMPPRFAVSAPPGVAVLLTEDPYGAFVTAARALLPDASTPATLFGMSERAAGAEVHASARLESGVIIEPLALVGPRAQVGTGTVIAAGAALGPDVCIGRRCAVGAGASIMNALIGDRVIIHPGVRLGQDGFGYRHGAGEDQRLPPTRRVIIQDNVEVGANAVIDRGSMRDTVLGEGTRIDNLVQIAQDVRIGRHCLIGAQSGIAAGVTVGDFVIMASQVAVAEHVAVGDRAKLPGRSMVVADVAAGAGLDSRAEPLRS